MLTVIQGCSKRAAFLLAGLQKVFLSGGIFKAFLLIR
jgi:hypothetical protein